MLRVWQLSAGIVCASAWVAWGQNTRLPICIGSESAAPGGMVQMKVAISEPKPITSGTTQLTFDPTLFSSVDGIALMNSTGNVSGAAVENGTDVSIRFTSGGGMINVTPGYPILTIAATVRPDAVRGQKGVLTLNAAGSWFQDLFGQPYPQNVSPGQFTVDTVPTISNVEPGGRTVPAGSVVTIFGTGFGPQTRVQFENATVVSTSVVSSNEVQVTLAQTVSMAGQKIQIDNNGPTTVYYSYLRATPTSQSNIDLLRRTVPVFSNIAALGGRFQAALPAHGRATFAGLALQNPNADAAHVTLQLLSISGEQIAATEMTLAPETRITAGVSEFFPDASAPMGSYVRFSSTLPVQSVGLLGDEGAGTVVPFNAFLLSGVATP